MYSIIAGESVFNSIAGFTLYEAFLSVHHNYQGLISRFFWIITETFLSVVIGYASGLGVSLVLKLSLKRQALNQGIVQIEVKSVEDIRNEAGRSSGSSSGVGLIFLFPWIAYLVAEVFNLTGMITIFCCGIALGQYGMRNLNPPERKVCLEVNPACRQILRDCFWSMPVNFLQLHRHCLLRLRSWYLVRIFWRRSLGFVAVIVCFVLVIVCRGVSVYIAGFINDLFFPGMITNKHKVLIWASEMRGAVGKPKK